MKLSCTNCNQSLEIPDELLGQTVECPVCKIKFTAGQSSTNSVYDVKPLMALCEKILLDEEVSVEELYELAAFLNANPEAGKHWPGNQFVEPLQEVWADGVIDSRELALMERLIVETRREWRRRVAPMEKTERPRQRSERIVPSPVLLGLRACAGGGSLAERRKTLAARAERRKTCPCTSGSTGNRQKYTPPGTGKTFTVSGPPGFRACRGHRTGNQIPVP